MTLGYAPVAAGPLRASLKLDALGSGLLGGGLAAAAGLLAEPLGLPVALLVRAYPCDQPEPELADPGGLVVPLRIRNAGGRELAFFSTVTVFGTPLDITVAELAIESFFPADAATAAALLA